VINKVKMNETRAAFSETHARSQAEFKPKRSKMQAKNDLLWFAPRRILFSTYGGVSNGNCGAVAGGCLTGPQGQSFNADASTFRKLALTTKGHQDLRLKASEAFAG